MGTTNKKPPFHLPLRTKLQILLLHSVKKLIVMYKLLLGHHVLEIVDGVSEKEFQMITTSVRCTKKLNFVKFDHATTKTSFKVFLSHRSSSISYVAEPYVLYQPSSASLDANQKELTDLDIVENAKTKNAARQMRPKPSRLTSYVRKVMPNSLKRWILSRPANVKTNAIHSNSTFSVR